MVLSDIEMPRMDGFDLVRNMRADPKLADLPVIMITSRIAQKHRDYAAELGRRPLPRQAVCRRRPAGPGRPLHGHGRAGRSVGRAASAHRIAGMPNSSTTSPS